MRPTDNMQNSFRKLKIPTSPELDEKIHEEISRVSGQTKKYIPAKPVIWRIIMKSKISKLAIATMIIIAVFIGIHYSGGSIDPASVAFAKATEALKKVSWIQIIGSDREEWTNYDLQISIYKGKDGKIIYSDYEEGKEYAYNPETKAIFIYTISGSIEEYLTFWQDQLSFFEEKKPDGKITSQKSELEEKEVFVYTLSWIASNGICYQSEVTVDKETDLPISAISKTINQDETITSENKSIFEYPQQGPSTIYDVGVPLDAKTYDYSTGELAIALKESNLKLRDLGLALIMYAEDHQGNFPDTLQECEGYLNGNLQWYLNNIEYLGKGQTNTDMKFTTPLAYDKTLSENGQRSNFVFADGHVEFSSIKNYIQ